MRRLLKGEFCLMLAAVLLSAGELQAKDRSKKSDDSPIHIETVKKGTSSRKEDKQARGLLPMQRLSSDKQRTVNEVLTKVSHFRKLPELQFEVDGDVYQYFAKNPEVAVSIWRAMDISKFKMVRTPDGRFSADAGDGSRGNATVLLQSPTECLAVCDGIYKNPLLLKPIHAKGLMHLRTTYHVDHKQKTMVTHKLNVWVSFPSTTIRTAARVLSPLTNMIMDRNFEEVSVFLQMMTLAMERQPAWVERMARRMPDVTGQQRLRLVDLTYNVNNRGLRRYSLTQQPDVSVQDIVAPLKTISPGSLQPLPRPPVRNAAHAEPNGTKTKRMEKTASGTARVSDGTSR